MAEKFLRGGGGSGRPRQGPKLLVLALSLLASGCFNYTVVSPAAVPPGSYVRVTLESGARVDAAPGVVPEGARSLRGRLAEGNSAETLRFSVALRSSDPSVAARGLRSVVAVPVADVSRVEVRTLDKRRTGALIGGGAIGAYFLTMWAFDVLLPEREEGGSPPGADNARIVLFRLKW